MKIIVLAGGLSTERDVSLSSAAGICRTLLEKGHDAFLLDVFMGLEHTPVSYTHLFASHSFPLKSKNGKKFPYIFLSLLCSKKEVPALLCQIPSE